MRLSKIYIGKIDTGLVLHWRVLSIYMNWMELYCRLNGKRNLMELYCRLSGKRNLMELLLSFDILMYICGILGQKKEKKKIHPLDHYNCILH